MVHRHWIGRSSRPRQDDYDHESQRLEFHHRPRDETPLKNGRDGERIVGLPDQVWALLKGYIANERHEVFDDYGREPLIASQVDRPSKIAFRTRCYFGTVPCLNQKCPHGTRRETCEFVDYSKASQCPSSQSPNQVRTGAITWLFNWEVPPQVVAKRVNTSVRVIKRHYDQADPWEETEERRREHLILLDFDEAGGGE